MLFDDSAMMPVGLAKAYQHTFVSSFPGTNTSWLLVGLLEAVVFLAIAASVLTGEFLPTRRKPILLTGLALAMFTFAIIAWGENITAGFSTVAELFQYLTDIAVLIVLILLMPRTARPTGYRGCSIATSTPPCHPRPSPTTARRTT